MITFTKPSIVTSGDKARLATTYTVDKEKSGQIWFEVDIAFRDYLCDERSDAFVIGVLHYAMLHGHDITCEAPIGEDLYYQLERYLIEALHTSSKVMHRTKLIAPVDSSTLFCANAVGTGISCGVDSLHAVANEYNLKFNRHNVTHLCFNNVGSHGEGERAKNLFATRKKRSKEFADKYGYIFVDGNSNIMDEFKQNHYRTHTFSSCFAVYALQKLYSIYYYSSAGYRFTDFSLKDNEKYGASRYELLSLSAVSTSSLKIYSEGDNKSRLEKLKEVVKYSPSYTYLDVCLNDSDNCSKCEKCIRTLLGLDILDSLDLYSDVFDIEYYKSHRNQYLESLYLYYIQGKNDYIEMYNALKKDIPIKIKLKIRISNTLRWVGNNCMSKSLYDKLKGLLN